MQIDLIFRFTNQPFHPGKSILLQEYNYLDIFLFTQFPLCIPFSRLHTKWNFLFIEPVYKSILYSIAAPQTQQKDTNLCCSLFFRFSCKKKSLGCFFWILSCSILFPKMYLKRWCVQNVSFLCIKYIFILKNTRFYGDFILFVESRALVLDFSNGLGQNGTFR